MLRSFVRIGTLKVIDAERLAAVGIPALADQAVDAAEGELVAIGEERLPNLYHPVLVL